MAKPQVQSPYKLSPSKFLFGFDRCKKCFYLDIKKGLSAPSTFPSIFSKYDVIHKNSTDGLRTEEVCPEMPRGTFIKGPGDKFLESVDIKGKNASGYISGKGDAFLKLDDGSYAVIDFKTTAMNAEKAKDYSSQLHAYKYALENNKDNKPHLSPITKLGILIFEPDINQKMKKNNSTSFGIMHKVEWFEIKINEKKFINYVKEVIDLLGSDKVPESDPSSPCLDCEFRMNIENKIYD